MRKLKFDGLNFSAIAALNAPPPGEDFFRSFAGVPILAADGAALRLLEIGVKADYVVGDLDSFYHNPRSKDFDTERIIYKPDQEFNDFEKTLSFALERGYRDVLIIGFHGGELEHTLNNASVLKKFQRKMNLCVYDSGRYAIMLDEGVEFAGTPNEMISLIPSPKAKLTTKGLKWELNCETLENGVREGARNRAVANTVEIEILEGELTLFIDARTPFAPVFSTIEGAAK